MTRKECLDKAAKCVLQDRNSSYGGPENSFGVIANFWSVYLGRKVYPADVAMMMALLKIARIKGNHGYADGYIDLAGYAACGAECAQTPAPEKQDEFVVLWKHKPKAESEKPRFMPGDRVQVRMPTANGDRWDDAVCVSVLPEGTGIRVDYKDYKGIAFGWPFVRHAPKAEGVEEPKFKAGDRVQYRVELPSVSDWIWRDATYLRRAFSWQQDGEHIVTDEELGPVTVKGRDIRPAPKKAEGVEELVVSPFDEEHMRQSMPGIVPQDGPSDFDAPQTKQELFQHIVDANPSLYRPRTPTGEELAEMAEEEGHE